MKIETKSAVIQSLQIGLNLLEILASEKEPLKFTEIQNLTSMTKSNLHKYLATLCQFGMVYRNQQNNTYTLGPKLVQLGNAALLGQSSIIEVAIPYFKKINEHTNLTALLAVPSVKGPLVSYILSADYGINIGAQIGATLPMSSSTGVIFSAFEVKPSLSEWEQEELSKLSNADLKELQYKKNETRNTLFASKIEPLIKHVSSFSVPIFNYNHELIGAITIVGHTETVPVTVDHPISQFVLDIALQISQSYGFSK